MAAAMHASKINFSSSMSIKSRTWTLPSPSTSSLAFPFGANRTHSHVSKTLQILATGTLQRTEEKSKLADAQVDEWVTKMGSLTSAHVAQQKQSCCYCGPKAHEGGANGEGCSLKCVCTWDSAHTCWQNTRQDCATVGDQDYLYIERSFIEATEFEPDNELLLADYALFLWHERQEYQKAEELLQRALSLEPQNPLIRMKVLNLYSSFMSLTPASDVKVEEHRRKLQDSL
mmetsp:Transcript_4604/g.8712  ORF Transcript_4604/g.8712 Transcript_4604/m.8712 type:complete len:230 (-) Transcript_4604:194-883(-)|eukprot:CAMPEP_0114251726 /NCGR_PEP_ID=MMETSP0058-20121206/15430_1 /TAXON_ID=36894 /ORGANISM="Pyramimonas parkeae, CCMP726" /LENGTH=229 /DNA_ID=CAMNT_0001365559 /DNA_START=47 /DNA_END=739 /DNA_ORIENTATION=+